MTEIRVEKSFCRICGGVCAVDVTIEDDKISKVRGDKSDPVTRGFTCFKGLQAAEQHHGPHRLKSSLKRQPSGDYAPIASEQALKEIASRLKSILDTHGPGSIALYTGTQAFMNVTGRPFARAFLEAVGSHQNYSTMTIDQSAKWIAEARMGTMASGRQAFHTSDVWMLVGTNPAVSLLGGPGLSGFASQDPIKNLKDSKARGMKLILIDPRRTETSSFADLFLQPRAGVDAILMAGILNVVLTENWFDHAFCDRFVHGLEDLKERLSPFQLDAVAAATDVPSADIVAAARVFALENKTGQAGTGTGADMGPRSNLTEHLVHALNVVCGRFLRAGDPLPNPGVLLPEHSRFEEVIPPYREWESGPKSNVHGLGRIKTQMMSATLADEILDTGPGRIRALICTGGNPAAALPDQVKAERALRQLELLVTVDPQMSATARLASYVIAPKVQYERPDHTGAMEFLMSAPYARYTPALIPPAPDMDVVDDWYVFWRLAKEMDLKLQIGGREVPMEAPPEMDAVMDLVTPTPRIPLEQVKSVRAGQIYEVQRVVQAPRPGHENKRIELLPTDVSEDLHSLQLELSRPAVLNPAFPYRLTVRREREVMNSLLTDFDGVRTRIPSPPLYMHPDEMPAHGLSSGDIVRISSAYESIVATIEGDDRLRRDVVQMTHCWWGGGAPEAKSGHTGRLVNSDWSPEAINRMPIMTAIPVRIEKWSAPEPSKMSAAST